MLKGKLQKEKKWCFGRNTWRAVCCFEPGDYGVSSISWFKASLLPWALEISGVCSWLCWELKHLRCLAEPRSCCLLYNHKHKSQDSAWCLRSTDAFISDLHSSTDRETFQKIVSKYTVSIFWFVKNCFTAIPPPKTWFTAPFTRGFDSYTDVWRNLFPWICCDGQTHIFPDFLGQSLFHSGRKLNYTLNRVGGNSQWSSTTVIVAHVMETWLTFG